MSKIKTAILQVSRLESVSISKTVLSSLEHCWTQVLYRIFKISTTDNVNYVSYYTGVLPLRYQIDLRKMRFYHNVYHRQYGSANSSTIVYDVLCKSIVNNLLFKHNVTIIDFLVLIPELHGIVLQVNCSVHSLLFLTFYLRPSFLVLSARLCFVVFVSLFVAAVMANKDLYITLIH